MRSFFIEVRVDDSYGTLGSHVQSDEFNARYRVILSPSQIERLNIHPVSVLAHELGHVAAHEFKLRAHKNFELQGFSPGRVLERENEAWDFAEAMFQVGRGRKYAIGRYEEALFPKPLTITLGAK